MNSNPWQAGDFARIAPSATIVGEILCDEIPIYAGQRLLDIGCGSGNTALAAARRRAYVSAVDPVPKLLETARQRAAAEFAEIDFQEAVAEKLPFPDESFDVVLSTFGLIFSTDPEAAVAEAARVLRSDGVFVFTAWSEGGMIDQLFRICEEVRPDIAMLPVARSWGRAVDARHWLEVHFSNTRVVHRALIQRALDGTKWLAGMKTFLAPAVLAYENLAPDQSAALDQRILALGAGYPPAPNGTMFIPSPYVEYHCRK